MFRSNANPLSALRRRLLVAGAGVAVLLSLGAIRLFDIQVVRHEHYAKRWNDQVFTKLTERAERGRIVFFGGEIAAISKQQSPSIFADPARITDFEQTAAALAIALDLPASELLANLRKYEALGRRFVWVKRFVSTKQRADVQALKLPGVHVRHESDRAYPRGELASLVIGGVGIDHTGLEGVERAFEPVLAGVPGERVFGRDALGRPIAVPDTWHRPAAPGADVRLTIDVHAQEVAQRELAAGVQRWGAKWGLALVVDVATGGIRAWAQVPVFDANDGGNAPAEHRRNRALTDPFEPGSAMKAFGDGTALALGAVRPDQQIHCQNGHWRYRSRRITDFHPYGKLSVADVLMKSSNIGSVKCVLAMGVGQPRSKEKAMDAWRKLAPALAQFGFGRKTGIELGGEAAGYVGAKDPSKRSYHTPISVAMGYECMVTPIQLAAAFNVIANDGVWVPPHVVAAVSRPDGSVLPPRPRPPARRVWTPAHAKLMREILARVVSPKGTARRAMVEGLPLGGKTSTVKKLNARGQYEENRNRCLFSCFGPVEQPAYTCIVVIDEPLHGGRKEQTGGTVAAPIAARIMAQLLGAQPPAAPEPKLRRDPAPAGDSADSAPQAPAVAGPPGPDAKPATPAKRTPRTVTDNDPDLDTPRPWVSSDLLPRTDKGSGDKK